MSDFSELSTNKLRPFRTPPKNGKLFTSLDTNFHVPTGNELQKLESTHSFKNVLGQYFDDVNVLQHEKDAQIQRLAAGEVEDIAEVTMAMNEAETSFQLMMEIRNKLVDAWNEVKNMQ